MNGGHVRLCAQPVPTHHLDPERPVYPRPPLRPFVTLRALIPALALSLAAGCVDTNPTEPIANEPNVPSTLRGRAVNVLGTVSVTNKNVTFNVWDSGQIDGDIISLNVNGDWVLENYTLGATKRAISVTLPSRGYSYVVLYAHNEGSLPPNTAALSINDGAREQNLVLSANLQTNGAYNLRVTP